MTTAPKPANEMSEPSFLGIPPGTVRNLAYFIYHRAPYPNETIAVVNAIAFISAMAARSHNINGLGLNQYLLTVASTGTGKEQGPDAIGQLMLALEAAHPMIRELRGPGEIISAPGLHKALAARTNPSMLCNIGEAGLMIAQLSSPRRDAIKAGVERILLHLYAKSGYGAVLDDAAYSDRQNNPGIVHSPALTLIGDTTPETLFGSLDHRMVVSGLLPRFVIFETNSPRPYQNRNRIFEPCPHLMDGLKRICVEALDRQAVKQVRNVGMTNEAASLLDEFERWTTDEINKSGDEISRHLWTRANAKALKMAAVNAVGVDATAPIITLDESRWATDLIANQTYALIGRFDRGEVGEETGNVLLQQDKVRAVMRECISRPFNEILKQYGGDKAEERRDNLALLHRAGIVTHQYLQRRLLNIACFKEGGRANEVLKKTLATLAENAEIKIAHPHLTKTVCGYGYLGYVFAEYDPKNMFEQSKTAVFFHDSATEFVKDKLK